MLQNGVTAPLQPPDDGKVSPIWVIGFVISYLLTAVLYIRWGDWGNIIFFPLVFLPSLVVLQLYRYLTSKHILSAKRIPSAHLLRAYGHSFFGGGLLALLSELWLQLTLILALSLVLGSSSTRVLRAIESDGLDELSSTACASPYVHLYLAISAVLVAGLVEEAVKGFLTQYSLKLYLPFTAHLSARDVDAVVWMALCIGLGFGSVEGVLYVCLYGGNKGFAAQSVLLLVRVAIAIPFHSVMGALWGVQLSRRECLGEEGRTWWRMGVQQVMLHGVYDFVEMEIGLDLVCAESVEAVQYAVSVGVAAVYTVGCAAWAWRCYRRVKKQGDVVADHEYLSQ